MRRLDKIGPPDVEKLGGVIATVKWYSARLGYGFVIPHNVSEEIFVHASVLRCAGIDALDAGQSVVVLISEIERGKRVAMIALRAADG